MAFDSECVFLFTLVYWFRKDVEIDCPNISGASHLIISRTNILWYIHYFEFTKHTINNRLRYTAASWRIYTTDNSTQRNLWKLIVFALLNPNILGPRKPKELFYLCVPLSLFFFLFLLLIYNLPKSAIWLHPKQKLQFNSSDEGSSLSVR